MIGILRAPEPHLFRPSLHLDRMSGTHGNNGGQSGADGKAAAKPKPRRANMEQQISFVSFDNGISQENRKAVRVQAAKASAAARKATIAKKLEQQRRESASVETPRVPPPVAAPSPAASSAGRTAKRKRSSLEPVEDERSGQHGKAMKPAAADVQHGYFPIHQSYYQAYPQQMVQGNTEAADDEIPRQPRYEISGPGAITPASSRSRTPQPTWSHTAGGNMQMPLTPDSTAYNILHTPSIRAVDRDHQDDEEVGADDDDPDAEFPAMTTLPSPGRVSLDMADPFACYPVPRHAIYDKLLHHMLTVFAPRGWPALKISRTEGLKWEWFMTQHALAEPALFYVRLLFASGDLIKSGTMSKDVSLWLQSEAIRCINEALQSPSRASSDGLILAVGRIALHESMYGNRQASTLIHRPAQRRMIDMRGGMKALDFPRLVKRLMRWSDRVMAMQSGSERLLPDEEDQGNTTFSVNQSVNVLESWVPQEGQALRKRIAISDLLSD